MRYFILSFIAISVFSCSATKKAYVGTKVNPDYHTKPNKKLVETLYLIGDAGYSDGEENYVLPKLERMLKSETEASSIVFLGDQIYPDGMPKKSSEDRIRAETILNSQLDILQEYQGKAFFIAGDKDWRGQDKKGLKAIKRQEKYIETYFSAQNKARFYPNNGCADPKVIKINKDLVYIFLDSQWWLQDWDDEKKINQGCDVKSKYDLLEVIKEELTQYKNDEVVIFMHHPIYSNGNHGGRFSWKDHLFPFAETENLAIPLPVLGSLFITGRNVTGLKQDISNRHYQELMGGIEETAKSIGVNVIFASAHENGLQHFSHDKLQFIVSGSGSKTHHIGKGGEANFAYQQRGFGRVLFYEDFEAWLEFYTVKSSHERAELSYRVQIRKPRPGSLEEEKKYPAVAVRDTVVPANASFVANSFKNLMLGDQYRDLWATPVEVEVINLETKFGGLTPIKKGGGMSSNSLRMEKQDGKQYILRSVNKDYRKLLPASLSSSIIVDIMQDQNSASHPYAALAIPALSKAAGVYYTHPQLVFLKHQKGLGNYNSQFPQELYLLEQRPSGDWSDAAQFGHSDKIISYSDLLADLREKKTYFVDQQWVCKSRLFDLFIHDWDRHDDQWRWATFTDEDRTICRPIPRDRDQAFFRFKGVVPSYIANFLAKQLKTMKDDVKDVKYLSLNARFFDRYFLNALEWKDWEKEVIALQEKLTDQEIDAAMTEFPAEIIDQGNEELGQMLKARRDNMLGYAKKFYNFLAQEVEITGTDHKDIFEITTTDDGITSVKVWVKRKEKGDLLKYKRTFYPRETKEIRLYGLRGKDEFRLKGADSKAIKIRIIGGEEEDLVINETRARKAMIYDSKGGVQLEGNKLVDNTSHDVNVNEYDRSSFAYNSTLPLLTFGYTLDDGFWLGGAYSWTKHAWRKSPYQSKQKLSLSIAPNSRRAIRASYSAHFPKVVGQLGFHPLVDLSIPEYENYFGIGNDSPVSNRKNSFNWVRLEAFKATPTLRLDAKDNRSFFQFGPIFETYKITNTEGRVSDDPELGFADESFDRRYFLGAKLQAESGFIDNQHSPTNGLKISGAFSYLNTLEREEEVIDFDVNLQFYLTLSYAPKLVLANNIGYQKVFGDPQFYQLPDLGNTTNLRGFRNNRFRGESAFYQNIDLRLSLLKIRKGFLPIDLGIVGGYDYGRVWLETEDSSTWHHSQTIGIWFDIMNVFLIQPYYSFTNEQNTFSLQLGFNF